MKKYLVAFLADKRQEIFTKDMELNDNEIPSKEIFETKVKILDYNNKPVKLYVFSWSKYE